MFKKLLVTSCCALALAGSLALPATAQAQWVIRGGFGYGFYGYPYGWYGPWGPWGYSAWGPYGWGGPWGYPYGGYYGSYGGGWASIRLEIQPKQAEVFVDGSQAGIVDNFDSWFESLNLIPGEHEIVVYLDGYRALHRRMYFSPASSQHIKGVLEKLAPGEQMEPRPMPAPPPPPDRQDPNLTVHPGQPYPYPPNGQQPPPDPYGRGGQPPQQPPPGQPDATARFGTLSLKIQPSDAEVFVDGHSWTGAASDVRLSIRLSAGRHHIEVHKEGFETYTEDVLIRPDATMTLNVGLTKR